MTASTLPRDKASQWGVPLWFPLLAGILYACPIWLVPYYSLLDHANYANHVRDWATILSSASIVSLPFREPLWFLSLGAIGAILPPEETIRFISVTSAFAFAAMIGRHYRAQPLAVALILSFPLLIINHLGAIRQGVALTVFLAGFLSQKKHQRWTLMSIAPFIHVGFFIILALWVSAWRINRLRFSPYLKTATIAALCLAMAVAIPIASLVIGTRQSGNYELFEARGSGLAFAFWAMILLLFVAAGRDFITKHLFSISVILLYLSMYWLVPIAGRTFEAGLVFVLLSGFSLPHAKRLLFILAISAYSVMLWAGLWDKPWLGLTVPQVAQDQHSPVQAPNSPDRTSDVGPT